MGLVMRELRKGLYGSDRALGKYDLNTLVDNGTKRNQHRWWAWRYQLLLGSTKLSSFNDAVGISPTATCFLHVRWADTARTELSMIQQLRCRGLRNSQELADHDNDRQYLLHLKLATATRPADAAAVPHPVSASNFTMGPSASPSCILGHL